MRVAVVGAGAGGLVAAHRLTKLGHECDVYERWPGLGGQSATLEVGAGQRIERYPHYLTERDPRLEGLLDEAGLPGEIEWLPSTAARTGGRGLGAALSRLRSATAGRAHRLQLGYPRGSFETLWARLAELIEERGGRVVLARPVIRIGRSGERLELGLAATPEPRPYDAVIATVPCDVFASLLDDGVANALDPGYLDALHAVRYRGRICLLLELERRLTTHHRTAVTDPELPFDAIVEQTNFVDIARYGGAHYAHVTARVGSGDPLFELDAPALLERFGPGLERVATGFARAWVRRCWASRDTHAEVVAAGGAGDGGPAIETGVADLLLITATAADARRGGFGAVIARAERAAELLTGRHEGTG